jgi:hypothetical protein
MRTAHILGVVAALTSSAILSLPTSAGGSMRPKLCRAAMRRKLHPNPRRDGRQGGREPDVTIEERRRVREPDVEIRRERRPGVDVEINR